MGRADDCGATVPPARRLVTVGHEFTRGSVWGFRYLDTDDLKPVVNVSNDGRNRSRFEWVHVVRITSRPKRPLPTIIDLAPTDAPLAGRAMVDEVELVHKDDLENRRGALSPPTRPSLLWLAAVKSEECVEQFLRQSDALSRPIRPGSRSQPSNGGGQSRSV